MSDLPDLPTATGAESIPPALAAPKGKRKQKPASIESAASAPETIADAPLPELPTAAASADPQNEEKTMATTFETAASTATEKTPFEKTGAMFADMNGRAKGAMEKGAAMAAELNTFGKGNVEAMVESGKIAVAGFQTLAQDQAAFIRKQFEEATTAARTIASAKSPTEFVKLQGDFVRAQFDGMVAEASRSTEAMLKLAGEVVQPLSNRWALAAEKVKQAA